ncbi:DUF3429 domain-containing protein [Acetobacteraceae bacterium KSS8]|uniref:DUF3429 domain-containing protein n=1 Tax=Endosaccharibacter trunci TaxID=2812733 RepID=A0ABT1W660_9PROT|nr:DUF3429 domain-containing protein [Acetobacteraceae bacterium KSS8]
MRTLPLLAILLGLAGLIPFVAGTAAILFYPADMPVPRLVGGVVGYGAVILSFLGAVHWGLALADDPVVSPHRGRITAARLALGVLPSLAGWAALLLLLTERPRLALVLLLLGFAVVTAVETRAGRAGHMPRGYLPLRWLLSAVVILCLGAILLARLF